MLSFLANMGKIIINFPESLHNQLRHNKVDSGEDIQDQIIRLVQENIKKLK